LFLPGDRLLGASDIAPAFFVDHTRRVKGNLLNFGIDGHLGIGQHHRPIDSPPHSWLNHIWLKGVHLCVLTSFPGAFSPTNGFILAGRDLPLSRPSDVSPTWPLKRAPQLFESSLPDVFAVGDVRAGSVKRVASAVGEGAISVSFVHHALAEP
jgi:hypothetical protein